MGRTTLMIEGALLRELKKKAATEGRTLQAVANDLLRKALMSPEEKHFTLRLQGWKAIEQPGVDILDRDKLFDLMDGR
jgi:plasmid stability protein